MDVTKSMLSSTSGTTACRFAHSNTRAFATKPRPVTGRPHTWQRAQANPMETAAPDVPPAVPPVAPPPPTLGMPPAPAEPKSLADQLLEAEAELEGLFGEDRLPPTAKQVGAMRERIAHLRALLSGKVSSSMPPGASQALTAAGLASVVSRAVADRTRVALRQTGDKTGILAHQYLDDDELEYALTVEQKWEADWLSAENAKLRRKAFDLLKRQEQLEGLLEAHIKTLRHQAKGTPSPQEALGAHKPTPLVAAELAPAASLPDLEKLPPVAPAPAEAPAPKERVPAAAATRTKVSAAQAASA